MTSTQGRRLLAVMFTDVVGYTALMQRDEEAARVVRRRHRQVLEVAVSAHRGDLLQYLGDGSLTMFPSVVDAVRAAIEVQRGLRQGPAVPLRIGIHQGDISFDTQGAYGDSVNIASRIQSLGTAGSVLISAKAHDEIKNQRDISMTPLGEFELKNVAQPVGIHAIVADALVVPTRGEILTGLGDEPDEEQDAIARLNAALGGRYRVERELGEGGMATVYLAEQIEPVRRRVALKVIKLGMHSKQVIARFEAERQALAVMDHPNVAGMLDAGSTEDGHPFFVMELVHGEPITDYCDRHRLTTAERGRLFIAVCQAVQHAHTKGVIHRDIKPANILVEVIDDRVVPKIIDFGIAKAVGVSLNDALFATRVGQIVGTPAYMSPEQAEQSGLDVDTRTDVYSLGVVLFEMLAGALPFDRSMFAKPDFVLQYLLRDKEAPTPSARLGSLADTQQTVARNRSTEVHTLRKELRGDLDWIVMRAMAKDRTYRYETPAMLGHDVDRYLNSQPVEARPPSTMYRASRFFRRHRVATSAAAAMALLLTGSSIALSVQADRLAKERDTAEAMSSFLVDLFEATDPYEGDDRRDTLSISEFVRIGAARVQTELDDQPAVQARMETVLGRVFRNLGRFDEARPLMEDAARIYAESNGEGSPEVVGSRQLLAFLLLDMGEAQEAAEMFEAAREARISVGMVADRRYGDALSGLGNARMTLGEFSEAEGAYREAIVAYEEAGDAGVSKLAQSRSNLAASLIRQAKYEEAEPLLREALELGGSELSEDHPTMLSFAGNLGFLLQDLKRYDEAVEVHRRTLELKRGRFEAPHPQIALTLNNLGSVLIELGELQEAEPVLIEAVEMRKAVYGPNHPNVATAMHNLASVQSRTARPEEAMATWAEVMRIFETAFGPSHPRIASALGGLARTAHELGDHEQAVRHLRRAEQIRVESLGEDHPLTASVRVTLGRDLTELGRYAEAETSLLAAHAALESRKDSESANWELALSHLVTLYTEWGRADSAARYQQELSVIEG
jgi:non-specific serine/threonine protein kinase/serine/threonine-protein kinase